MQFIEIAALNRRTIPEFSVYKGIILTSQVGICCT